MRGLEHAGGSARKLHAVQVADHVAGGGQRQPRHGTVRGGDLSGAEKRQHPVGIDPPEAARVQEYRPRAAGGNLREHRIDVPVVQRGRNLDDPHVSAHPRADGGPSPVSRSRVREAPLQPSLHLARACAYETAVLRRAPARTPEKNAAPQMSPHPVGSPEGAPGEAGKSHTAGAPSSPAARTCTPRLPRVTAIMRARPPKALAAADTGSGVTRENSANSSSFICTVSKHPAHSRRTEDNGAAASVALDAQEQRVKIGV